MKLKRDHDRELEETIERLNGSYENHVENLKQDSLDKLAQQEKDLSEKLEQEKERLCVEKRELIAQFESERNDLKSKCKSSEEEVERLDNLIRESEKGLGSASSHINSLKQVLNETRDELQITRKDLKDAESRSAKLMVSLFCILLRFTPDSTKSKIDQFSKIKYWVKLKNKQHHTIK